MSTVAFLDARRPSDDAVYARFQDLALAEAQKAARGCRCSYAPFGAFLAVVRRRGEDGWWCFDASWSLRRIADMLARSPRHAALAGEMRAAADETRDRGTAASRRGSPECAR